MEQAVTRKLAGRRPTALRLCLWLLAAQGSVAVAQNVQTPPAVKQQVSDIEDRFAVVLDEECPPNSCFSVGCRASKFDTLDKSQDASLPGFEDDKTAAGAPQYRLMSVLCEFAYEPSLSDADMSSIRQRVTQKVKTVGVNVMLTTRQLEAKPEPAAAAAVVPAPAPPATWQEALAQKLLPFIPWFLVALVLVLLTLLLIWGARRLGRSERRQPGARTRAGDGLAAGPGAALELAEPTPRMLLQRVEQLRGELKADHRLVELTLKKHFDDEAYDELCGFLYQFGPELLAPFKEKQEYRERLGILSEKYSSKEVSSDPAASWRFLNNLERSMTAAKVRIDAEPLADDFAFLSALEIEEFVGILRDMDEEAAIVAVAYAPRRLRERFFAHANPAFTAKFVEHLTRVDKMPDAFVRKVAQQLRQIYASKGETLRSSRVDRIPLLEEALNALAPAKRRQLIADLGKDKPDFMHQLAPAVFLDDSLPLLPPAVLAETLLVVAPEEAAHYLAAFPWAAQVLAKVSPRLAEAIKMHMPATPVEDSPLARSARVKIAAFVRKQHAIGTIDLRQINTPLVGGEAK